MIPKGGNILNVDKLVFAIVKCAVDDYKTELRGKARFQSKGAYVNTSIESFFKSEYFDFLISQTKLSGVRGEDIVEALKEKEAKRAKKRNKKTNTGR